MNTDSEAAQLSQAQTLYYDGSKVGLKLWVKVTFNLFYGNIYVSCINSYILVRFIKYMSLQDFQN